LNSLLAELNQNCNVALNLEVSDEALIKRLLGRGRQDDNEVTIGRRLEVYREQTAPVIDFYHNEGLLKSIDGDRPMEDVTAALKACVSV